MVSLVSCSGLKGLEEAPSWVEDLTKDLRCGMTLEKVEDLAGERETIPLERIYFADRDAEESFYVDGEWADIELLFAKGSLVSYQRTFIDGFKSIQASPLVNLCTGELRYGIQLNYPSTLDGSKVYVNGQLQDSRTEIFLEVGKHEIRIEKDGYVPVIRELDLKNDRQARGNISLIIGQGEVEPLNGRGESKQ